MNALISPSLYFCLRYLTSSKFYVGFFILFVAIQQICFAQIDFGIYHRKQAQQTTSVVQTEQVRAELVAHAPQGIGLNKPLQLGLLLQHQPHWHTYWKNPGDSGLATQLQWDVPTGIKPGEFEWPIPQKIAIGSLANFGYENQVLLPVPFAIDSSFKPIPGQDKLNIQLQASWLVCKEECIPQEGRFNLQLPLQGTIAMHAALFDAANKAQPGSHSGKAQALITPDGILLQVDGLPPAWSNKAINAFTEAPELTLHAQSPQASDTVLSTRTAKAGVQGWDQGVWSALLPLNEHRMANPEQLNVVLSLGNQGVRINPTIDGKWPALKAKASIPPELQAALDAQLQNTAPQATNSTGMTGLLLVLTSALLGGLILNLMPCVFPVLAIKVLGFASEHRQPGALRQQGWAYTLGVVMSFVALGGLLLALRAGGEQLGWGFQLQSPWVICSLAALFTLIGLNLMGLLEAGNILPSGLATLQLRHPLGDAFLSGVLAVAIASPCTAPFMGASLGYALTQPGIQALAIFAALGVGLALPYLVLSYFPALGQKLPRPGAWMDTLRRFLAFPMWATVIWLVWVLGHLSGVDSAAGLLALLLSMAMLVWALQLRGNSRWWVAGVALLAIAGTGNALVTQLSQDAAPSAKAPLQGWQTWEPGRVESELQAGRAVFVDFTAAWCITCQYNKKTTLSNTDVLNDFSAKQVTLLRADWTRRDPAITLALQALGRSGVPVYVLYQNGRAPVIFSEVLSTQALRDAIQSL